MSKRRHGRVTRKLKEWLLDTFGDGINVQCAFKGCGKWLTYETMTVDKFPIRNRDGGTYNRNNVRVACRECNERDGRNEDIKRSGVTFKGNYYPRRNNEQV